MTSLRKRFSFSKKTSQTREEAYAWVLLQIVCHSDDHDSAALARSVLREHGHPFKTVATDRGSA